MPDKNKRYYVFIDEIQFVTAVQNPYVDDPEGKITFTPVMDPAFAAENAGVYFNIYAEQPAADALDPENRGEGLNIADGYTPDENVKDFWVVYETQATLTGGQLTDPESADTVDVNTNEQFVGFQGRAAE